MGINKVVIAMVSQTSALLVIATDLLFQFRRMRFATHAALFCLFILDPTTAKIRARTRTIARMRMRTWGFSRALILS